MVDLSVFRLLWNALVDLIFLRFSKFPIVSKLWSNLKLRGIRFKNNVKHLIYWFKCMHSSILLQEDSLWWKVKMRNFHKNRKILYISYNMLIFTIENDYCRRLKVFSFTIKSQVLIKIILIKRALRSLIFVTMICQIITSLTLSYFGSVLVLRAVVSKVQMFMS